MTRACIVAVGSEMLTPFRMDTNSLFITGRLNEIGCDVRVKSVVADDVSEIAAVFASALEWADILIVTGGLGPTEDDLTRDAIARVLDVPLDLDAAIVASLRERFARRGYVMTDNNKRQALVPRGGLVLANPNGSAPGIYIEHEGTAIALLPGPPREMKPMLDALISERLAAQTGGAVLYRRVLKIAGHNESYVDAHAEPIYSRWTSQPIPIATTILAVNWQIELHLAARTGAPNDAARALDGAVEELRREFGSALYSVDGRPMERVVGDLLRSRGWTIALAESCTGGLLASRLTDVPGSSDYVDRGVVCYSNRAKTDLAGVDPATIAEFGAVSEPVARAMAEGIRGRAAADVGIGVTGIAGPGGGTPDKPVGTVAIAVALESATHARTFRLFGEREAVKYQSATWAMNMLRLLMLDQPPSP